MTADRGSSAPNQSSVNTPSGDLSRGKKRLFQLIAVSLPILAFFLLEFGLRLLTEVDTSGDRHVNISPFSIFTQLTVKGEPHYRITHSFAYAERKVQFPVKKRKNTLRVFCLGGSACAGWPHPPGELFSDYLEQSLQAAYPDKKVEVINAAAHGFASYRIRPIFDDVIDLDADAVILYSGNNEFLEKRSYAGAEPSWVDSLAGSLRTVQWLNSHFLEKKTDLSGEELNDVALFFWKKVKRQTLELREDPEQFEQTKAHFEESITYMVEKGAEKGVPVILCTVPVNLRDWLPTVSCNRLHGAEKDRWWDFLVQGRRAILENRYEEGIRALETARDLEPEHAETRFWLGRAQEARGLIQEARESYQAACDLDYNPFRASSLFNRAVKRVALKYPRTYLADLEQAFMNAAKHQVPGFDLFLDYVHASKQGGLVIAETLFETFVEKRIFSQDPVLKVFTRDEIPIDTKGNLYDDRKDVHLQRRMFKLFAMNHQYEAALDKVRQICEIASGKPILGEIRKLPPTFPPQMKEGYEAIKRHVRNQRREILGQPVRPEEAQATEKMLNDFYEKWYPYGKY